MNGRRWLLFILAVYSLLGIAYSWVTPLGESPDEIDHFLYVRYLVEQRKFPVMQPVAEQNETMEANQPPLFYLLNALVTGPLPMTASAELPQNACYTFDPHDGGRANFYLHDSAEQNPLSDAYLAFRAARLLSVVQGIVIIWLAYGLGRQLVPHDDRAALLGAAVVAFNPQFIFITSSVNNDVLTAVIGAALVYFSVAALKRPALGRFVGLGLLLGAALLTKFALLALWPLPLLTGLLTARNGQRRLAVQAIVLLLVLPLLVAGWWYLRAYRLYGDPLAWEVHLLAKGSEVLRTTPFTGVDGWEFIRVHFQSYWAWFGWLKIQAPGWVYGLLAGGTAVSLAGLALVVKDWRLFRRQSADFSVDPLAVLFNVLAVGAIYASLLRYIQTINWSGYQGRLAYAAVAPAAALLGLGWWRLAQLLTGRLTRKPVSRAIVWLPAAALLFLSLGSLRQLSVSFARPDLFAPPADWRRVCIDTPAGFYVTAVDWPADVRPGEALPVALSGYGALAGQANAEMVLLNGDGAVLATAVTDLAWPAKSSVTVMESLAVPPDALPARARVQLLVAGAAYELGFVKIAPLVPVTAVPSQPLQANFDDELALLGYDWQSDGSTLRLTTYWQALTRLSQDYTIFVHVLDDAGQLIAQHDSPPQGGRYPTSIWNAGEIVVDEVTLILPPDTAPAQIAVGLYQLDTLERLPVVGSLGETAVSLPMPQP